MHKKRKHSLRASTLTEMLVVMILSGIILLSVFDGLSLFEKLLRRFSGELDRSISRMEGFYRLESLFADTDSLRQERDALVFYRAGESGWRIFREDSLLVVEYPDRPGDTLFRKIVDWRTISTAENNEGIDSLILVHDTTTLRFGVNRSPHRNAAQEIETLEKQYRDED